MQGPAPVGPLGERESFREAHRHEVVTGVRVMDRPDRGGSAATRSRSARPNLHLTHALIRSGLLLCCAFLLQLHADEGLAEISACGGK